MEKETRKYISALIAIYILCYILPLEYRDLVIPDETRYAEIPREMISGGDWIVPRLNGLRYFEKPVLGYWVNAVSILLFGENNFAVRFPSALAAGLSALLIYLLVYKAYRKDNNIKYMTSVFAALIFLTSFEVLGIGNTAVLDGIFSFFLTACIAIFFIASEEKRGSKREKLFLLLSGVFCGFAFLTKGFLSFVIPVLVITPYLIWQNRYKDLLRMSWLPLLCSVLVSLPWSIAIYSREPDFWRFFIWNEHLRRFVADNAQHSTPFWFFCLIFPAVILPWTFLAPAAAGGIRAQLNRSLARFSVCWLVLPFLFFSISKGKIITYILPCFPPFAVLMAIGLSSMLEKEKSRPFNIGVVFAGIFISLILLLFVYIQIFGYRGFYLFSQPWKVLMAIDCFLFFILFCILSLKSRNTGNGVFLFIIAPLLLYFSVHFLVPDLTLEKKSPGSLLKRNKHDVRQETVVISDAASVGAACWYLKRSDVYLIEKAAELDYGLRYADSAGRLLDIESTEKLIIKNRGNAVLLSKINNIRKWRVHLSKPISQDYNGPEGFEFSQY